MPTSRSTVFVSYVPQDAKWLKRVKVHFAHLEREGLLVLWDDTKIPPGANRREALQNALSHARIAIMLVSADFLASESIHQKELPPLLDKAAQGGAVIFSVILEHCTFSQHPGLSKYQAVNSPERPLAAMSKSDREAIFVKLALEVGRYQTPLNSPVPDGAVKSEDKPPVKAGSSPASRPFEVIANVRDAQFVIAGVPATAVRTAREQRVGAPRREVAVVFAAAGQRFGLDDVAQIARDAQISAHIGNHVFPDFTLHNRPTRIGDCAHWTPPANEDQERVFAIDKVGSVASIELIRESAKYATLYEVSGVSIVTCLRRLIGAALFARAVASQHSDVTHAWIIFRLELVPEMHLAIDPSGQPLRDPKPDKFITAGREVQEGGWFDPRMDDANIESFVLKIMARVTSRFGCDDYRALLKDEIQRFLGLWRVPPVHLPGGGSGTSRRRTAEPHH